MNLSELRDHADPRAVLAALSERADELRQAGHVHSPSAHDSVRTATHRGHEIVVRTSYTITVDGRPFDVQPSVNNAGLVHYHGLPTRNFPSVIDLVTSAIDAFPDDFGDAALDQAPPHGSGSHHPGEIHP